MKIEIAESMVYSWLRKVRNCRIVQTNWKPAPEWERSNDAELDGLMQESTSYFADLLNKSEVSFSEDSEGPEYGAEDKLTDTSESSRIFKNTASLEQLITQTECDVLGLTVENGRYKAIAVEVAFHENGLNYSGGRIVTAKKIVAKFLRVIFALRAYFGVEEAELIFASPHVKKATLSQVSEMMNALNAFLSKVNLGGFSVSVLFNDDFYSKLLAPLVASVKNHGATDGSELFVRALKLVDLENKLPAAPRPSLKEASELVSSLTPIQVDCDDSLSSSCGSAICGQRENNALNTYNDMTIGEIVKDIVIPMLVEDRCTEEEITRLTQYDYCHQIFGTTFPVLSSIRVRTNGVFRYYSDPLTINGRTYYLSAQWYERQRERLTRWIDRHLQD